MTDQSNQQNSDAPQAKFHNPPNILRQKVGFGGIDPKRIQKAEDYIQDNKLDFAPFAEDIVLRLDIAVSQAKTGKVEHKHALDHLKRTIMELKANGGMFRYPLLSEVAGVVLNFLENIEKIDQEALEILDAHQNTIAVIVKNRLGGTGGTAGRALAEELYKACNRYYQKHNIEIKG